MNGTYHITTEVILLGQGHLEEAGNKKGKLEPDLHLQTKNFQWAWAILGQQRPRKTCTCLSWSIECWKGDALSRKQDLWADAMVCSKLQKLERPWQPTNVPNELQVFAWPLLHLLCSEKLGRLWQPTNVPNELQVFAWHLAGRSICCVLKSSNDYGNLRICPMSSKFSLDFRLVGVSAMFWKARTTMAMCPMSSNFSLDSWLVSSICSVPVKARRTMATYEFAQRAPNFRLSSGLYLQCSCKSSHNYGNLRVCPTSSKFLLVIWLVSSICSAPAKAAWTHLNSTFLSSTCGRRQAVYVEVKFCPVFAHDTL